VPLKGDVMMVKESMYSNFPLKNTNTGSITVKTFLTRFIK
jgi:hypothetical protein